MDIPKVCCVILQLSLLCTAQHFLTLSPQNPVVSLGGSIILNCSINCPGGETTWKGLDTTLGGLSTSPGYSVLKITNASISMEGTKICVGSCPGNKKKSLQRSLNLQVYALPPSLHMTAHPEVDPPTLRFSMYGVYPPSSTTISCYQGSEMLETSDQFEEDLMDEEGYLLMLKGSLAIPSEDQWLPGTTYRCVAELELAVGGLVFTREGTLQLPNKVGSTTAVTTQIADTFATSRGSINKRYTSPASPNTIPGIQKTSTLRHDPVNAVTDNMTLRPLKTTTVTNQQISSKQETLLLLTTTRGNLTRHDTVSGSITNMPVQQDPTSLPTIDPGTTSKVSDKQDLKSLPVAHLRTTTEASVLQDLRSLPAANQMTTSNVSVIQALPSLPTAHQRSTHSASVRLNSLLLPSTHQENTSKEPPLLYTALQRTSPNVSIKAKSTLPSPGHRATPLSAVIIRTERDGFGMTWTIVPAVGLGGGFLTLAVQLYRRLNQKGSFNPTLP
ncbi:mucosal addressin cell adhesion molecule 1 isoform 2-T2 [Discoglossus pictus]